MAMNQTQKVGRPPNKPRKSTLRHRQNRHLNLLLQVILALSINCIGNAFIPSFFGPPIHRAVAMSTDNTQAAPPKPLSAENNNSGESSNNNSNQEQQLQQPSSETLLLPPNEEGDPSIPRIQLGDTISFAEMGPVIINADGSTRRIDNWDKMTKHEQEVAWRRIAKRNEARRAALLEQQRLVEEEQLKEQEKEG